MIQSLDSTLQITEDTVLNPMTEWRDSTFGFLLTVMEEILGEGSQSGMTLELDS